MNMLRFLALLLLVPGIAFGQPRTSTPPFGGNLPNSTTGYAQGNVTALRVLYGVQYQEGFASGRNSLVALGVTCNFGCGAMGPFALSSVTNANTESFAYGSFAGERWNGFAGTFIGEHVVGFDTGGSGLTSGDYVTGVGNDSMRDAFATEGTSTLGANTLADATFAQDNTISGAFALHGNAGSLTVAGTPNIGDVLHIALSTTNANVTGLPATANYTVVGGDTLDSIGVGIAAALNALPAITENLSSGITTQVENGTVFAAYTRTNGGSQAGTVGFHFPGGQTNGWKITAVTSCTGTCSEAVTANVPLQAAGNVISGKYAAYCITCNTVSFNDIGGELAATSVTTGGGNPFANNTLHGYEVLANAANIRNTTAYGDEVGSVVCRNVNSDVFIGVNSTTDCRTATENQTFRLGLGSGDVAVITASGGTAPYEVGIGSGVLANDTSSTGGNVAVGENALSALTTGFWNVGIGNGAGTRITTGQRNVAIGFVALAHQTVNSGSIAIGDNSLTAYADTSGGVMTAVGSGALASQTTGTDNDAFGAGTLGNAVTGATQDTGLGEHVLRGCTTCTAITAVGHGSMGGDDTSLQATTSTANTYIGDWSAQENTTGSHNAGVGTNTQIAVNTGNYNASLGFDAFCGNLNCNQTGGSGSNSASNNVAVGAYALLQETGNNNTAIGYQSMDTATSAHDNTSVGYQSLFSCLDTNCINNVVIGEMAAYGLNNFNNVVIGYSAGKSMNLDSENVLVGRNSFLSHTGNDNVAIGSGALVGGAGHTSNNNVAIGFNAGAENAVIGSNGNNNDFIGYQVGSVTTSTGSNNVLIGTSSSCDTPLSTTSNYLGICAGSTPVISVTGAGTPSTSATIIAGTIAVSGITTDVTHTDSSVCQDTTTHQFYFGSGTLGICLGTSSLRYKNDWRPMDDGLSSVMALKPGNYFYKPGYGDGGTKLQYGFLAEDTVNVLPKLTGLDADGKPNSVDILGMVPVIVKAVQQQQAEIEAVASGRAADAANPLTLIRAKMAEQQTEIYALFFWSFLMTGAFGFAMRRR